ncbi:hypothetical protein PU629_16865 [Pullulanibacillus sp. KACC 23026]|uniref:hypothetical protein n=1 Tax=Pullulanibacillus sp. KACC 23026 TaxID=3028315 RepID=UPI0023B12155|nr:hypothetical protein [Pullulanibacillus sp. KACC 23026]WEG11797.1 hypothetical protein PU629_16865 [Pullulanibacillus sp. KACC 23026]
MGYPLTQKEVEWSKAYIIWRSLLKGLKKDYNRLGSCDLQFVFVYRDLLAHVIGQVEKELAKLSRFTIRVSPTDQPTVWEARVGSHHGYIEVNVTQIILELKKLIFNLELGKWVNHS